MLEWGGLMARLEQAGHPMPAVDSLVAAVALHHNLTLVTRNQAGFAHSGVTVFNTWQP